MDALKFAGSLFELVDTWALKICRVKNLSEKERRHFLKKSQISHEIHEFIHEKSHIIHEKVPNAK